MKNVIDYKSSPAPAFDAVEDVIFWLGKSYDKIAREMALVKDCRTFAFYCRFVGIQGFPVKAWYEHFHGQGSWKDEQE